MSTTLLRDCETLRWAARGFLMARSSPRATQEVVLGGWEGFSLEGQRLDERREELVVNTPYATKDGRPKRMRLHYDRTALEWAGPVALKVAETSDDFKGHEMMALCRLFNELREG